MERQVQNAEVIQAALDSFKASVYLRLGGAIIAYYPETLTADIQPMQADPRTDPDTGVVTYEVSGPFLQVPIAWPRFGGFAIVGNLLPGDPVVLEAFDLDPSSWIEGGRSIKPANPADLRRLGGNYWLARPDDLVTPFKSTATAVAGLVIGADGVPLAQIAFTPKGVTIGAGPGAVASTAAGVSMGATPLPLASGPPTAAAMTALGAFATAVETAAQAVITAAPPMEPELVALCTALVGACAALVAAMTTAATAVPTTTTKGT